MKFLLKQFFLQFIWKTVEFFFVRFWVWSFFWYQCLIKLIEWIFSRTIFIFWKIPEKFIFFLYLQWGAYQLFLCVFINLPYILIIFQNKINIFIYVTFFIFFTFTDLRNDWSIYLKIYGFWNFLWALMGIIYLIIILKICLLIL